MIAPLSRIFARYVSGALVAYGLVTPDDAAAMTPELIALAGAALAAITEALYALAVRKGWAK
jgi:hypothetical protein